MAVAPTAELKSYNKTGKKNVFLGKGHSSSSNISCRKTAHHPVGVEWLHVGDNPISGRSFTVAALS